MRNLKDLKKNCIAFSLDVLKNEVKQISILYSVQRYHRNTVLGIFKYFTVHTSAIFQQ